MVIEITNLRLIPVLLLLVITPSASASGQTNNSTDWFYKGMILYNENQFNESLQAYEKAIQLNPANEDAWNGKGMALGTLGRYEEALQAFNRATRINSSCAEAWYNMGAIFDLTGKYFLAIQAYNEATRINPNYQKAWAAKNNDINIVGMENYRKFNRQGMA
jgi:tetratricopeptide (TPR) repeat protein